MNLIEKMIENISQVCRDDFIFLKWSIVSSNATDEGIRAQYKITYKENIAANHVELKKETAIREMVEGLIDPLKNPYSYKFKDVSFDFYNELADKCETKKEQELMIKLFAKFMINYGYNSLEKINTWIAYPYGDLLLKEYLNSNAFNKEAIVELLENLDFSRHKIDIELIDLAFKKTAAYYIKKMPVLKKLKETISTYYPEHVERLKFYWKKIEVNEDKPFTTSGTCVYVGFNKKQLFSMDLDKNFNFHNSKYKTVNTFFNKEQVKQKLGIEHSVFDGVNALQDEYRFIFFNVKDTEYTKKTVINFMTEFSKINQDYNLEIMKKTLDYVILNDNIANTTNAHNKARTKI